MSGAISLISINALIVWTGTILLSFYFLRRIIRIRTVLTERQIPTRLFVTLYGHLFPFYILLTVHFITVFVNNQLDAQFFFLYLFSSVLYKFRATKCSSSGESTVSI